MTSPPLPRPARTKKDVAALVRRVRAGSGLIALGTIQVVQAGSALLWIAITRTVGGVFALILLFEQWGWRPLAAAVAQLGRLSPVAALERAIKRLPPYGALVVFGVPVALLFPIKLLALYLITDGHVVSAVALFIAAKVVGTAIVAHLYHLTAPQLMEIGWLRNAHDILVPRLHALKEDIRATWAWRYGRLLRLETRRFVRPIVLQVTAQITSFLSRRSRKA